MAKGWSWLLYAAAAYNWSPVKNSEALGNAWVLADLK